MGHQLTEHLSNPGTSAPGTSAPGTAAPGTAAARIVTFVPIALLTLMVGSLAVVDPHTPGHYPSCPFHAITGLWCPGCGGLRAVHDLTHGHLLAALHENVLVVLLGPSLVIWWLVARRRRTAGRPITLVLSPRSTLFVLVLLAVFAIVRNLPFGAGLAP